MALSSIPLNKGGLIVLEKSQLNPSWLKFRSTYLSTTLAADGTESGWLSCYPQTWIDQHLSPCGNPLRWVSAEFQPGDVVILDLKVLHMSGTNTTNELRISCETRWIPLDPHGCHHL